MILHRLGDDTKAKVNTRQRCERQKKCRKGILVTLDTIVLGTLTCKPPLQESKDTSQTNSMQPEQLLTHSTTSQSQISKAPRGPFPSC